MPPISLVGTSSSKPKGSHSYAEGPTLAEIHVKLKQDDTYDAIGKFIFSNGIPFHVSRSPYYKEMVKAITEA